MTTPDESQEKAQRLEVPPARDAVVLGAIAFVAAAAVGLLFGERIPTVHDEFAYLLLGETFAQGRLTNPTPMFWEHLEAFHILLTPSYTGKYPPGQGLVIALGMLLGHPIIGIWLSVAFMVSATTWMLQGWLPRKWAWVGGGLVLLQVGIASSWAQAYWGGALAAGAGALLYGSLRRAWLGPKVWHGVTGGLALLLLANSRPFEGLAVSLPAMVAFLVLLRSRPRGRRVVLGLLLVLLPGFAAMGSYNQAVTGSSVRMPYQEYHEQYESTPVLWVGSLREDPPTYRHNVFDALWNSWEVERYRTIRTLPGFFKTRLFALFTQAFTLLGLAALGLMFLGGALADRWIRIVVAGAALAVTATLLSSWAFPHYLAPGFPLLVLLALEGWRRVALRGSAFGRRLLATAVIWSALMPLAQIAFFERLGPNVFQDRREETRSCLEGLPFPSLVLVEYVGHLVHRGAWVRNGPDPWSSKVTWARSMGPARDSVLAAAYPDRAVWKATADATDTADLSVALESVRLPTNAPPSSGGAAAACR